MIETLSIVGSICSILSLVIAIFIVNDVVKIKNNMKIDNSNNKSIRTKSRIKGNDNIVSGNDTTIKR